MTRLLALALAAVLAAPLAARAVPDPMALKNALWLLTDQKYKNALSSWLKKRSKAVFAAENSERAPSFTREQPARFIQPPAAFPFDRDAWRARAAALSAAFKSYP